MKEKNSVAKSILTTLLGDLETKAKNSGSDITDPAVVQTCKKFISNNTATMNEAISAEQRSVLQTENEILNSYLPQQLTESEVRAIIVELNATNIGQVMKHLNTNYNGKVDNRLAQQIAKEVI